MAQINDPNVTAQIATLANTGIIDTDQIVALLNTALPAGQQIAVGAGEPQLQVVSTITMYIHIIHKLVLLRKLNLHWHMDTLMQVVLLH